MSKWYSIYHTRPYFSLDSADYKEIMNLHQQIEINGNVPSNYAFFKRDAYGGGLSGLLDLVRPQGEVAFYQKIDKTKDEHSCKETYHTQPVFRQFVKKILDFF